MVKCYEFLEEIYDEFNNSFEPFVYFENGSRLPYFIGIRGHQKDKLRKIAYDYQEYTESLSKDYLESLSRNVADTMQKYWKYAEPEGSEYYQSGYPRELNFMDILYNGTLECVSITVLTCLKKQVKFDMGQFEGLTIEIVGTKLKELGLGDSILLSKLKSKRKRGENINLVEDERSLLVLNRLRDEHYLDSNYQWCASFVKKAYRGVVAFEIAREVGEETYAKLFAPFWDEKTDSITDAFRNAKGTGTEPEMKAMLSCMFKKYSKDLQRMITDEDRVRQALRNL